MGMTTDRTTARKGIRTAPALLATLALTVGLAVAVPAPALAAQATPGWSRLDPAPPVAAVRPRGPVVGTVGTLAAGRSPAQRIFGRPRSGKPWHSGFWAGGVASAGRIAAAGAWRGAPMDVATTYGNYGTWAEMAASEWNITTFDGFPGRLAYGLPLLPRNRAGHWEDILSGSHDHVFATVARQLVKAGRGTSAVRVGWEANGTWYPWAVTARTAPKFRAAVRRVVSVMKAQAPRLTFWLDLAAGTALPGQTSRLDPLTRLYPGDGVLHGVSMDHYDQWNTRARTRGGFTRSTRPAAAAGLADAATFARVHRIGFAVPEWGLNGVHGSGDNPLFVERMFAFFKANRDVLVFESYFNEADPYIANALWGARQNPKAAAVYRRLW